MKEKIAVIGGSYFIGKSIVEYLLKNNFEVYVINRGTRKMQEEVKQISCDRNDCSSMKKALDEYTFDYIIDVSGLNAYQANNLIKSINTTRLKKFVFISSSAVYDVEHLSIPYQEEYPLAYNQYWKEYGCDKIEAEHVYLNFFHKKEISCIILRPPYVYGEHNYAQRESFIFHQLEQHRPIFISKNNPMIQFIYTKDLSMIVLEILKSNFPTTILNVGNKEGITVKQWIEACMKVCNITTNIIEIDYHYYHLSIRDFFCFHDYNNVLDISKIHQLIEYKETPFHKGLTNSYQWYLEHKDTIVFKQEVDDTIQYLLTLI